jgi:SAM-dependent methyltransferase
MINLNRSYWDRLYDTGQTGWDIGYVNTPLKVYFDQLSDKSIRVLVPGAGKGYEVDYLFKNGFKNVFWSDFSASAAKYFKNLSPDFPEDQILLKNFFELDETFDLIVESAFFTSVEPEQREQLAHKMFRLLKPGGKYVGLFFNHEFGFDHPPYGAVKETYIELVKELFTIKTLEPAYNSIKARAGRELFFIFEKK